MNIFKRHKELIPIAVVIMIVCLAMYNLLSDQAEHSSFTQSGASVLPAQFSGGAGRCNIPTYEEYYGREMPTPESDKSSRNSAVSR